MIKNLFAVISVFLLFSGGIFTEHENIECKRDHLTTVKVHKLDCAHENYSCLECTDYAQSSISQITIRRVAGGKKIIPRNKRVYTHFSLTNRDFNHWLSYTPSTKPPGNLVIHKLLASVIILS